MSALPKGIYIIRNKAHRDNVLTVSEVYVDFGSPVFGKPQLLPPILQEWVVILTEILEPHDRPKMPGDYTIAPAARQFQGQYVLTKGKGVFVNRPHEPIPQSFAIEPIVKIGGNDTYSIAVIGETKYFHLDHPEEPVGLHEEITEKAEWILEFIRPIEA